MWMEEKIGERINLNRTTEAVGTGADQIAVGCPFCRVMLSDGLTSLQADGKAREEVEVLDVAQLLLASVKRAPAAEAAQAVASSGGSADSGTSPAAAGTATAVLDRPEEPGEAPRDEATRAEPQPGDVTQTQDTVSDPRDVGPDAAAAEHPDPEVEATDDCDTEPARAAKAAEPAAEDDQGKLF